jgi:hypothetical protein
MINNPKNDYEALVLALKLSVTASTKEKSQECVDIAESLAFKLTELEVVRAKREVEKSLSL